MTKTAGGILAASLLVALALPVAAQQQLAPKKIQCWTDAQGNRACGDHVPPEFAKQERQRIDAQGRTLETLQRERTPDELAAQQKAAAEAAAAKATAEREAAYDRFLVDSYSSVKDLERARNERLATLDGRSNLARQAVVDDEKSREAIQQRIDKLLKEGRPAAGPQKQVRDIDKTLRENRAAIEQMQKDREKVCVDSRRDIERFQRLTMGDVAYVGQCPEPGSPALVAAAAAPKVKAGKMNKKNDKPKPSVMKVK